MSSKAKSDVELSDLYFKLGEIDAKLDSLVTMQTKVIYALIALAGATVGLKVMSTPPLLVVSSFVNAFIFLFAGILAVGRRQQLQGWQYLLGFGVMGVAGNMHKVVAPGSVWIRTCIFIVANLSLLVCLWRLVDGKQKQIDDRSECY